MTRDSGARVTYVDTATVLGRGRIGLIGSTLVYVLALRRHLRRHRGQYQLVHAHFGFPDAFAAAICVRRERLPLVVTLHGHDALLVMPRRNIIGAVLRWSSAKANTVICVSQAMADVVRTLLPRADLRVILNGLDDRLFRLVHVPRDAGILFVGLLEPWKNVDLLLRAYSGVQARLGVPMVIAGDGPLRTDLERLSRELDVSEYVHFTGYLSRAEVADLMQRASVLALPSSSEGFGMVAAEALACGTPVVASNVGGLPEIITSPALGTLVPAGDQDALADALVKWTTGTIDHDEIAAATGMHPWAEQVRPIAALYSELTRRANARES